MSFTYVYVLQSKRDGLFYIGMTSDLRRRFLQHQHGQNTSTAKRLPVRLIFYEAYLSESDARRRERYFKTTKGKVTLRAMLSDYLTNLDVARRLKDEGRRRVVPQPTPVAI